jgi:pantoate--beta-alanine ligase
MRVERTVREIRDLVASWKADGQTVGLVPTMGYLHQGHGSLVEKAVAENDRVVVSIFVNPTQFAPGEDLDAYPRDLEKDCALCESLGAAAIFHPEPQEMYPLGFTTFVEVPALSVGLCGRKRPTHFRGVATVVLKLLNIVEPRRAYFGLKDAQQFFVLRRMARDLNLAVQLAPCPIVRESDNLAMSSRNSYLSPDERKAAPVLNRALVAASKLLESGERRAAPLISLIKDTVSMVPMVKLEYAEVVETDGLSAVEEIDCEVLVAIAARLGRTRLIDNFIFNPRRS